MKVVDAFIMKVIWEAFVDKLPRQTKENPGTVYVDV